MQDLKALSADLKDPALEGTNDEGESLLYHALVQHLYDLHISKEQLYEYDQNIIRHTKEINVRRTEKIQWKYYQYLSLLFTEVFLDKYFADRKALLNDINEFQENVFNFKPDTWHGVPPFEEDDLNKLAFWCATGSGKTLLMHVNIKQYLHYAAKYRAPKLNRIIILTPNEGCQSNICKSCTFLIYRLSCFQKIAVGCFKERQLKSSTLISLLKRW